MFDAIGQLVVAVIATIVSALVLDWWSGWRGKAWLFARLRRVFRRLGMKGETSRLLIFVSAGGTCRDPMAVAIARKIIRDNVPELKRLQVEGRALLASPSKPEASYAARMAIRDLLGEDMLKDYIPAAISPTDLERADLILVMSRNLLHKNVLPERKTYLFKAFFGLEGDIDDPWPDGKDAATLARYRKTAEEIKSVLEPNLSRLVRALA